MKDFAKVTGMNYIKGSKLIMLVGENHIWISKKKLAKILLDYDYKQRNKIK